MPSILHLSVNQEELDNLLKNQQFLIDYIQKLQLIRWKKLQWHYFN